MYVEKRARPAFTPSAPLIADGLQKKSIDLLVLFPGCTEKLRAMICATAVLLYSMRASAKGIVAE